MKPIKRKKGISAMRRKERMTADTYRPGFKNLLILNVTPDTSPRDLVMFFARQDFRVEDVRIGLDLVEALGFVQAYITLPESEAVEAMEWARGRFWRGQRLDVQVRDRGEL